MELKVDFIDFVTSAFIFLVCKHQSTACHEFLTDIGRSRQSLPPITGGRPDPCSEQLPFNGSQELGSAHFILKVFAAVNYKVQLTVLMGITPGPLNSVI